MWPRLMAPRRGRPTWHAAPVLSQGLWEMVGEANHLGLIHQHAPPFHKVESFWPEVRPAPAEFNATASRGCLVLPDPQGGGGYCCGKHTPQTPGSAAQQVAGLWAQSGWEKGGRGLQRRGPLTPAARATGLLWGAEGFQVRPPTA